jgi:hypothetical protein
MTAVTLSREALAKALWVARAVDETTSREWAERAWDDMGGSEPSEERVEHELLADALIASGVVVPLDTLADDEALVDRFIDALGTWPTEPGIRETSRKVARTYLRALVAALSERGER